MAPASTNAATRNAAERVTPSSRILTSIQGMLVALQITMSYPAPYATVSMSWR